MSGAAAPDLVGAAIELVEAEGWSAYSPLRLAGTTEVGLAACCLELPDQGAVLAALGRRADCAMLDVPPGELLEMSPKERLFELLMRRFESLGFARPALRRLGWETSPEAWVAGVCSLGGAMKRVLEASDAAPPGVRGLVAGAALAAAYLRVARVWLDDETPDEAATMAALNARLDEIARFLR